MWSSELRFPTTGDHILRFILHSKKKSHPSFWALGMRHVTYILEKWKSTFVSKSHPFNSYIRIIMISRNSGVKKKVQIFNVLSLSKRYQLMSYSILLHCERTNEHEVHCDCYTNQTQTSSCVFFFISMSVSVCESNIYVCVNQTLTSSCGFLCGVCVNQT